MSSKGWRLLCKPNAMCIRCGSGFHIEPSAIRNGGGKFCTKACSLADQKERAEQSLWNSFSRIDGCWEWTGPKTAGGYGLFAQTSAHRAVYERLRGPIPEGLDLDHLCRNRGCVNPAHMEPVTRSENLRRGYTARRAQADQRCDVAAPSGIASDSAGLTVAAPGAARDCDPI